MTAPRILAIDAAAHFGWAYGRPGEMPVSGHHWFATKAKAQATYPQVMQGAIQWCVAFLKQNPTDYLLIERAIPDTTLEGKTNYETSEMKNGLIGILTGMSRAMGVYNCGLVIANGSPGDTRVWLSTIRSKFVPKQPKGTALKPIIRQRCIDLGWITEEEAREDRGFDRTDALAIWYCACLHVDPRNTVPVDDLFIAAEKRKRLAVARGAAAMNARAQMMEPF